MHIEKDNFNLDHLLLQDRADVYSANKLVRIGGVKLPVGVTVTSWPFTPGGEFPKTINNEFTEICVSAIASLTEQSVDEVKTELSTPGITEYNTSVHEIITDAFLSRLMAK